MNPWYKCCVVSTNRDGLKDTYGDHLLTRTQLSMLWSKHAGGTSVRKKISYVKQRRVTYPTPQSSALQSLSIKHCVASSSQMTFVLHFFPRSACSSYDCQTSFPKRSIARNCRHQCITRLRIVIKKF